VQEDKGVPPNWRRMLMIVLGLVALVELALWAGVSKGWFTHLK
jgi:hypothetical protein